MSSSLQARASDPAGSGTSLPLLTTPEDPRMQVRHAIRTNHPITLVLKLAIPGILGMLTVGLKNFVDALFVGQVVGETALAAVAMTFPLGILWTSIAGLIGVGSGSLLSRAIGAGDEETQKQVFGNLVGMVLIGSLIMSILGYVTAEPAVRFMGGRGDIATYGVAYLRVLMVGSVFFTMGVATNMLIRSEGKMREAMIFSSLTVVANITFNAVFVVWLGWGVEGAALGTVAAMAVYSALNFWYFLSGRSSLPIQGFRIQLVPALMPEIFAVGSSAMLLQVMALVEQTLVYQTISQYGGDRDIAFAGASLRILMLAVIPVFGFSQALQPVLGINFGANDYPRMKRSLIVFGISGTLLMFLIWLPFQLVPEIPLRWLLPDMVFVPQDLLNFRILTMLLPVLPFLHCGITLFQSIGNGRMAGLMILLRQGALFAPILVILSRWAGLNGVYYSLSLMDGLMVGIVAVAIVLQMRQLERRMVLDPTSTV
ncbi:MAG: MATE family efflux transporter [Synechococcaceae cyanobacterium SM2_3_2]|nr:MATE family efflux transporter [Synechococcaceae cyanobacterium SM2_3_2]